MLHSKKKKITLNAVRRITKQERKNKPKSKDGKRQRRNYSLLHSKKIPYEAMTAVNNIKIPSVPGSCYHAILCSLAENKDKFCTWEKLIPLTAKFMRMYGGERAWKQFVTKKNAKPYYERIKENVHTLTRSGKDCYGYRLHELGMCIYYFTDGTILFTGGRLTKRGGKYNVEFNDGRKLQKRYRGTTMSYREYARFMSKGLIDESGEILDWDEVRKERKECKYSTINGRTYVSVNLKNTFDQNTAIRFERLGLVVEEAVGMQLIGIMPYENFKQLKSDPDVRSLA